MLIREVLNKGFRITECYVDTVGPSKQYQTKLESMFPGIAYVRADQPLLTSTALQSSPKPTSRIPSSAPRRSAPKSLAMRS